MDSRALSNDLLECCVFNIINNKMSLTSLNHTNLFNIAKNVSMLSSSAAQKLCIE